MSEHSTGTAIEQNGRRIIAMILVQDGGRDYELIGTVYLIAPIASTPPYSFISSDFKGNFLNSIQTNAHEFAHKKLLIAALDEKSAMRCRYHGFKNVLKIQKTSLQNGTSHSDFFLIKYQLIHTLLSLNISVLSMSIDQVVLKNPMMGLVGDTDLEIGTNYPKVSMLFSQLAIEVPTQTGLHDISDSLNIGFMLLRGDGYWSYRLVQSMIMSEHSLFSRSKAFSSHQRRFNLFALASIHMPGYFCYGY